MDNPSTATLPGHFPAKMPETPDDLFADLDEARLAVPDYRQAYCMLNNVFTRCLSVGARMVDLRFGGIFATTDYLLKEHHAPSSLRVAVNDARVRLRNLRQLPDEDLAAHFASDGRALALFVGLVARADVPPTLLAHFPPMATKRRPQLVGERLRLIVNHWDDTFLYANVDAEEVEGEQKVFYGGKSSAAVYSDWDWSYLKPLLRQGTQLNAIRPRLHEGVLYPELLIVEPDYLVDISSVAACFENYGASPINHLLNRLKPAPVTQPIVLGNLAGQLLDDCLLLMPHDCDYGQSVRRFFRSSAATLLAADLTPDFHTQAQNQLRNIQHTLRHTLPTLLSGDQLRFDATDFMVEPSFFSEMLGLQGRMDFLQLGQKVLIEQKSGKGGFPQPDPDTPVYQRKHYVQLLLYMLLLRYNYRDTYERNNHELHAFLLYSRYQKGLLPVGFAPDLMFDAIRLRNQIAASEYAYARDGLSLLTTLTADTLNVNHIGGTLWQRYQRPQLEALLAPISQASPLEQAYYLRFLHFIQTEHVMAKVGSQTRENSGFADKWNSSLADKLQAGTIFCSLQLLSPTASDEGRVGELTLAFGGTTRAEVSTFRPGDIVILYSYAEGAEPDARRTMVFRTTIVSITTTHLTLSLRATQVSAHVFWHDGPRLWAVEPDFYESSFSSLYRAMHAFLSAPKARRDLLLLQRRPRVDTSLTLSGDYGAFNTLVLRARQSRDMFLIIGPPGTGKTSFGLLNCLQEELLSNPSASVLLLSYTNRAVDEICGKLTESGLSFIRLGGRYSCDEAFRPFLLDTVAGQAASLEELRQIVAQTRIFVGTTTAYNAHASVFRLKTFSLAIVDEASQILEPHLVGLLSATTDGGESAIQRFILIGDHKQLSAVVQQSEQTSAVDDEQLRAIHLTNCRLSLFERLLSQYRDSDDITYMLTRQGRMHPDIASFPNHAFYGDRLLEVPLVHQQATLPTTASSGNALADLLLTRRVAFVHVSPSLPVVADKVNHNEAVAIAATVVKVYELERQRFDPLLTVGVIVPYRNQIAEVRASLEACGISALRTITVDTVERFQGSQRDYIVYGFTVQKAYQLDFLTSNVFTDDGATIDRKLNVAMTRARRHLLLIGNGTLLGRNALFGQLIDYLITQKSVVQVSLDDYIAGRFNLP